MGESIDSLQAEARTAIRRVFMYPAAHTSVVGSLEALGRFVDDCIDAAKMARDLSGERGNLHAEVAAAQGEEMEKLKERSASLITHADSYWDNPNCDEANAERSEAAALIERAKALIERAKAIESEQRKEAR